MTAIEFITIYTVGVTTGMILYRLFRPPDKGFKAGWDAAFIAISKITWHVTLKDYSEDEENPGR